MDNMLIYGNNTEELLSVILRNKLSSENIVGLWIRKIRKFSKEIAINVPPSSILTSALDQSASKLTMPLLNGKTLANGTSI